MSHLEDPVLVEHLSNVDAPIVFQAIPSQAEHFQAAIAGQALGQHLSPRGLQAATGGHSFPETDVLKGGLKVHLSQASAALLNISAQQQRHGWLSQPAMQSQ